MKLTSAQRAIVRFMRDDPDSIIRQSKSPTGRECYRVLDSKINPRCVANKGVVSRLYMKGGLIKEDGVFKIHPDMLKRGKK